MTFFLDLWHDLREKRLWPVAVGLLAAAVAIPLIMLKPAADPSTPTPIAVDSGEQETLPAVNVDGAPVRGSKLETFAARDPFKPLADLADDEKGGSGDGGGDSGSSDGGSLIGGGSTGGSGSDGGSAPGGSSDLPDLPDLPSGGDGSGPTTPSTPQPEQWYRFAVDVKFGTPANQQTLKEVPRLASLPDAESPAVVFMGVTDGGDRAVFYVADASLTADGEGECQDEATCRVITLGLNGSSDEATFTSSDGTVQYDLQLLRIRREAMDEPQSQGKQVEEPVDEPAEKAASQTIAGSEDEFLPLVLASADVAFDTE
jgi:hypothetical protein